MNVIVLNRNQIIYPTAVDNFNVWRASLKILHTIINISFFNPGFSVFERVENLLQNRMLHFIIRNRVGN